MTQDRSDKLGSGIPSQLAEAAGRPILASLTTVSDLLRTFVAAAIDRRALYLDQKMSGAEAQGKDVEEARALADLLNGKGPRTADFFVQQWNSPEQMGNSLKETYGLECTDEEAVFTILISMINEVYGTVDFLNEQERDVEENGWMIDGIIEMYAYAILGLPWDDDE